MEAVKASGINSGYSLADIDRKKETLDQEISEELFHSSDIYKTEKIQEKEYFKFAPNFPRSGHYNSSKLINISCEKIKSSTPFKPVDISGNEIREIECSFDGQGSCKVEYKQNRDSVNFTPAILFNKGDKKKGVNNRLIAALSKSVSEIKSQLLSALEIVSNNFTKIESELASLFVPTDKTNLAILGISEQVESLKLRIKDCERLEELCR